MDTSLSKLWEMGRAGKPSKLIGSQSRGRAGKPGKLMGSQSQT